MVRGTKIINNKNISLNKSINKIEMPDYVYIPLVTYNNKKCKFLGKIGNYVYKGEKLATSNDKYDLGVYSSVSGFIRGIEKRIFIDNTLVDTIIIENDFKEREKAKKGAKKKINNYTKEEVITLLKNCGVIGMSGTGFPTYFKYGMDLKIKKLIINAVEGEPYMTADFSVLNSYTSEILEAIDALIEIFKIEEAIIVLKNYNQKAISDLKEYMGSYTKIKVKTVKDIYPIGYEKSLIKALFNINIKTNPIEKGILVNNISTIYDIYKVLKYQKPITERIMTISGEGIKKPQNVLVKEGVLISEIIKQIGGYKFKKGLLVVNGPMIGKTLETDNVAVTKQVFGIVFLKDVKCKIEDCINCGKCVNICPVRISPIEIMKNKKNPSKLKKLKPEKCIKCGLCSYICPSNINLKEEVIESIRVGGD